MNRRKISIVIVLSLVLAFCFSSVSAQAIQKKLTVQLYKPANNLVLAPDVSGQLVSVNRYSFTFKGFKNLNSIEKLLKSIDAEQISPSSVKWICSNEKVAKVSSRGKVTGIKKGKCFVYPVPKGVYSYHTSGKWIFYLTGNLGNGLRIYGGIGAKVKVNKE